MRYKDFQINEAVKINTDFSGIKASSIGVVKEITGTGVTIEWELPDKPVTHLNLNELHYLEPYWRLNHREV